MLKRVQCLELPVTHINHRRPPSNTANKTKKKWWSSPCTAILPTAVTQTQAQVSRKPLSSFPSTSCLFAFLLHTFPALSHAPRPSDPHYHDPQQTHPQHALTQPRMLSCSHPPTTLVPAGLGHVHAKQKAVGWKKKVILIIQIKPVNALSLA